ncbi:bifunctional orotidine-5'-phosphate decarboxylase/orotate phosphoribosyltransferase [Aphanothece sacrum]|uniref:Orotate phosphoribosyltransferase n=1 Tax=Aphanothece sacrum FPU1 TaxID=1920663 RepID=A0A401IN29_APHSA|nr:bifunctional orotidine-5'-phosphate decarboxylase/orotate phosphoribosyltransferase [Aphanothece sacrum]GBF82651.1 orotidine 5'-phosphate decarboxylase/Orotate phosphoribosyltransferase [Aphanothece sacrum FPU1]GBF86168.1 orotidine 5'-phosphate decarboxylase [Aphanothece sacrum FPU3]
MNFFDKLNQAIASHDSLLIVGLDPNPEMMPHLYCTQEGPESLIIELEKWLKSIIVQTSELVCAYKPTLGFYEVLGAPGLDLLGKVIAAIPDDIPIILDAKHSDINTSTIFAQAIFEKWGVDAVTVNPYAGQDQVAPFLVYPDKGIFILCHTSNPGAVALQEYPTPDAPFYLQVVKEVKTWGTIEQLFLEVGTTDVEVIKKVRSIAPERFILLRSIWSNSQNFDSILTAGLNIHGEGLLIPVPQDLLKENELIEPIKSLNQQINQIRNEVIKEQSSCQLWTPNVCGLKHHPHHNLILQLYDIGCLLFGEYVQASGATFSYYIDLRQIISNPQLFHQVLNAYADILKTLTFDRIAGIPYGSLPTATGLSLMLHHPMIYPRKEVKAHGTRRLIEGTFNLGEKVVVVDDILISGKSVMEGAEKLTSSGLNVEDIVVFIDHEEGVKNKLKNNGYNAYSVLTISEITETLYEAGRINYEQYHKLEN